MNVPDITIVLNLHREGVLASYTLRSLSDAALHAAAAGLSVELVAVLDSPDATTRAVLRGFDGMAFVRVEILEVAHRSLGPSRNAGIDAAHGAYVVVADGDDLYSFNYLAAMHATAAAGAHVIALPEFNVSFGADDLVQQCVPLARSGRFRLAGSHTFLSCIIAPTSLLRDLRYRDCAGSRAYAYEDYDLNCRAVAAGADLRIATDAVLFYRKHASSIMAAIGDATRRIVPPNALFDPAAFAAADAGDAVIDDPETLRPGVMAFRRSHRLAELVAHASAIEPRIELARIRDAPIYTTAHFERGFGATFHTLCRRLGAERFDDVLVVSSLAACPPSLLRIAESPARRCLIVEMARGTAADTPATRAPVVALDAYEPALPARRRPEMVVRLVHAFAARACLHLLLGGEVDELSSAFAEALKGNNVIAYALRAGGADPGRARTIESSAFAAIDLVVSDDPAILDTLVSRIPIYARKVLLLEEQRDPREAGRWLAAAYDRLEPRAKESRWTT